MNELYYYVAAFDGFFLLQLALFAVEQAQDCLESIDPIYGVVLHFLRLLLLFLYVDV